MKDKTLRLAIAQVNSTVGDLQGNAAKISRYIKKAKDCGADIVCFPELALCGYPPEDLLFKESFIQSAEAALQVIAKEIGPTPAIVGTALKKNKRIYNAAAALQNGKTTWTYFKRKLPNYGVFDEKRYFSPGKDLGLFKVKGVPIGISICEDIWDRDPKTSVCLIQARAGAKILINISASPFHAGKFTVRNGILRRLVREARVPVLYINMVGGQDELVYDGRSMAMDAGGQLRVLAKSFEEDIALVHFDLKNGQVHSIWKEKAPMPSGIEEIHHALVVGIRDYVNKNRFKSVILGLSGGVDSALTAALAVQAIGRDRVVAVSMPSKYSSKATQADAVKLAKNLGIQLMIIPIGEILKVYLKVLAPHFEGKAPDATEENLQSRIRAMILMALSNKFGHLVLSTGNKSEITVGYCTLYGDMAGGFSVLKDAPKGMVYALSRLVNKQTRPPAIPQSTLDRAPSAELKHNQKDQDTLPPYPMLDRIIQGYIEEDMGYQELAREGLNPKVLQKVIHMADSSEYKRRQSPPGVKITPKSFGRDRRMPITNRFSEW